MTQPGNQEPKPKIRNREIRNPKSDKELLEERAKALASLPTEEALEEETLHLLTFSLAGERYGVEVDLAQEIQPMERRIWSRVPNTPGFIIGAANIRGRIHSVMDIGRFLGLKSRPISDEAHVIVVQSNPKGGDEAMELCILTDDLPQVANISRSEVQTEHATVSGQAQEYVHGVTEDMLIVLDLDRLLQNPKIIVHQEV